MLPPPFLTLKKMRKVKATPKLFPKTRSCPKKKNRRRYVKILEARAEAWLYI